MKSQGGEIIMTKALIIIDVQKAFGYTTRRAWIK